MPGERHAFAITRMLLRRTPSPQPTNVGQMSSMAQTDLPLAPGVQEPDPPPRPDTAPIAELPPGLRAMPERDKERWRSAPISWWPYALSHGVSPVLTHAIFEPNEPGHHAIDTANPSGLTYLTLRAFIRDHNVSAIIVQDGLSGQWASVIRAATQVSPIATGGVQVYRLGQAISPARRSPPSNRPGTHHHRGGGHTGRRRPRATATPGQSG